MTAGDDTFQVVVFGVGDHEFAFDIFRVQRIIPYRRPAAVPQAPPFLEGVLQVEGAVVPVIDLRKRFGLAHAPIGPDTRILIVEVEGAAVGAVVDEAREVLRVPAGAVAPPPPVVRGLAAAYVHGIIALTARTVVLLNAARVLTTAERLALEQVRAEASHG